jgi:ParB-like chromosome segregation protein Spo0J
MKLEHFFLDGKVTYVAPNILNASAENPRVSLRLSDPARFEGLKASIKQGFFAPIIVEGSTLEIVGGHQRVDAARELGMKEVPVCS